MSSENKPTPQFPRYFRPVLMAILGIPLVIAILFTEMQWYPATYVINRMSDEQGMFPERSAIAVNYFLMLSGILIIVLLLLLIKKIFTRK